MSTCCNFAVESLQDRRRASTVEMVSSEQQSIAFYERLGAEGLAARTSAAWDQQIVTRLREMILPGQRVLDAGCGYGRIAIPMAQAGYEVIGLDYSDGLLRVARERADAANVAVRWIRESMCRMTLADDSFDVVICLWSAFNELLEEEEQIAAVKEMHRVLRRGGWALIEGPMFTPATAAEIASGKRYGRENRLSLDVIADLSNPHYSHDRESLANVMERAEVAPFQIYTEEWAGRPRQLLRIDRKVGPVQRQGGNGNWLNDP
jgi:ubiquinone/menaquinone biosynthesis C-methylase UbiE